MAIYHILRLNILVISVFSLFACYDDERFLKYLDDETRAVYEHFLALGYVNQWAASYDCDSQLLVKYFVYTYHHVEYHALSLDKGRNWHIIMGSHVQNQGRYTDKSITSIDFVIQDMPYNLFIFNRDLNADLTIVQANGQKSVKVNCMIDLSALDKDLEKSYIRKHYAILREFWQWYQDNGYVVNQ